MFTQNYINHTWNRFFGVASPSNSIGGTGLKGKSYVGTTGNTISGYAHSDMMATDIGRALWFPVFSSTFGTGIYFGTGATPATRDDYTLESVITTGLQNVYHTVSIVKEADGRYSVCGQYTLKNISDEPINIYEIGCFVSINTSSSAKAPILLERTVLGIPITIGHGDTKLITYKLTFNQALNVEE